ncbi:hypothetical protein MMC29_001643, partial [Sticta canariensis]|nr:hypothetical protein [Sticta canariensis]
MPAFLAIMVSDEVCQMVAGTMPLSYLMQDLASTNGIAHQGRFLLSSSDIGLSAAGLASWVTLMEKTPIVVSELSTM